MESCTLKMNIIITTIINNNNKQQLREAEYITHVRFSNETTLIISYTQLNGEKRKRKKKKKNKLEKIRQKKGRYFIWSLTKESNIITEHTKCSFVWILNKFLVVTL